MNVESVRKICRAFPGVVEDVKWGNNLVFSVADKMFALVSLEPPHPLAFKCTDESFADLTERPGLIPAPYLARAKWVQEHSLGEALERPELMVLLRAGYDTVVAKLPKSRRPGAPPPKATRATRVAARQKRRLR